MGLAAAAVVPLTAAQASPAVDRRQDNESRIVMFPGNGKCLDVEGGSQADETPIVQYTCGDGADQRFTVNVVRGDEIEIRTFAGKCVEVKDRIREEGTPMVQSTCFGAYNQRLRLVSVPDGGYEIHTDDDRKCLNVKDRSRA
ncbi:RICIN domain-containing protein [Streptomyces sp. NPDC002540]